MDVKFPIGELKVSEKGDHLLWNPFNFHVHSGEKVAVIGSNGTGKTTLLKKIINEGQGITISPAVKIGYFSAEFQRLLNEKSKLIDQS